jgi:hypothetical protein
MTTADYERNMVLSNVDYKVVGTRPVRHDGADKVTGRAIYGADFDASGLLHGKNSEKSTCSRKDPVHRYKQSRSTRWR